jgi:hypothetical protein
MAGLAVIRDTHRAAASDGESRNRALDELRIHSNARAAKSCSFTAVVTALSLPGRSSVTRLTSTTRP